MISIDPVNIHFHIPATDPLGREEVLGKLRFLPDHVALSWRLKGNVFQGGKGEMTSIDLPYGEIEHVELVKKWFKIRRIILRISDPELVKEIPGVEMGKMTLHIDARSREEAKKLRSLIDFKRSVFVLDEHEKRLKAMKEPG
ncbi:MAG: hypothetical protein ACPG32_00230 [Akkermansiaceae bacterium]